MPLSSSPSDHSDAAGAMPSAAWSPVVLSERSLTLLALVRIFVGLLWFQQLAWKMPPTFGGLRRYVESDRMEPATSRCGLTSGGKKRRG